MQDVEALIMRLNPSAQLIKFNTNTNEFLLVQKGYFFINVMEECNLDIDPGEYPQLLNLILKETFKGLGEFTVIKKGLE